MKSAVDNKSDLSIRVEAALDTIRPYLEADGGNVRISEITEDQHLKLEFVGTCRSCPMSSMTFKAGVEEAIKKAVPEVKKIEIINLIAAD
jgi:Fe-S cluster biogenesis protein NfuA